MANDREVLREVWEGKIPVCFQLDQEEVEMQQPDPYYLMAPRVSYFPLITDKVRKHFLRFIPNDKQDGEMWLDSNGTPIRWHYPVGLLFDLLSLDSSNLPWPLTVHFGKFPDHIIWRCSNKETVEAHFMACLKEADVLKHRGAVVSAMQKRDHTQLWLGLLNDKFDQFWAINRRLMETVGDQEGFKHIPVRCYSEDGNFFQRLVCPIGTDGTRKTLADLITELSAGIGRKAVRACTHGVPIPAEAPLQWLSEHLSYPDNFLHLCITYE